MCEKVISRLVWICKRGCSLSAPRISQLHKVFSLLSDLGTSCSPSKGSLALRESIKAAFTQLRNIMERNDKSGASLVSSERAVRIPSITHFLRTQFMRKRGCRLSYTHARASLSVRICRRDKRGYAHFSCIRRRREIYSPRFGLRSLA